MDLFIQQIFIESSYIQDSFLHPGNTSLNKMNKTVAQLSSFCTNSTVVNLSLSHGFQYHLCDDNYYQGESNPENRNHCKAFY